MLRYSDMSDSLSKRVSWLVSCLCFTCTLTAQPVREVPAYMHIEVANERLEQADYYNALTQFEEAYKQERTNDLAHQIAMLHYKLRDYKRAERWLARVIKNDQTGMYPDAVYAYANTLKRTGKYEEAVEAYNIYANIVADPSQLTLADAEVEGIQMAIGAEAPIELVIEHMGRRINSRYSELSPTMHPSGALYLAALPSAELVLHTDAKFAEVYMSEKDRRDAWAKPKALDENINRPGYHTANPSFSDDGTTMYFTRALMEGDEIVESKIYFSSERGSSWGAANEIEAINGDYIATHPTEGALLGNRVLIFAANMPGGVGGYDLYYSLNQGGEYGAPVNMGDNINTVGDEFTPYFRDNVLYYSSDGHPGFGGLDIFSADWDGSKWSEPENLGPGYNTGYDDWYFKANNEGTQGFLVSNRPGDDARSIKSKTCCDEIYTFELRDVVVNLLTTVFDKETREPLDAATVTNFEVVNNRTGASESKTNDDGNDFNFLLDFDKTYKVTIERNGYFPQEFQFNTVGLVEAHTFNSEIFLERAPTAEPETRTITINEPIRLNNIYYDFDDDKILEDAELDLNAILGLMDEYSDMVIELSSHTDSRGKDSYNDRLSQRRAQSAVDWLINRGIDPNRLQAVGYGERSILNRCANGVKCTEDEHRFNRRTEFKIIEGPTSIEIKVDDLPQGQKKK